MKVLIIDDSAIVRKSLQKMVLQVHPNAECDFAEDGDIALKKITDDSYDIYTIDYHMPGADGEIVAIAAKTSSPRAKICMITSDSESKMQARVERIGVKFLNKLDFESQLLKFLSE